MIHGGSRFQEKMRISFTLHTAATGHPVNLDGLCPLATSAARMLGTWCSVPPNTGGGDAPLEKAHRT